MIDRVIVRKGEYHDSAFLMRITRELKGLDGVAEAVVLMGTGMNRSLLAEAGFGVEGIEGATPMDLVIAIRAAGPEIADRAERELARLLAGGTGGGKTAAAASGPRTIAEAAAAGASLVTVAVPGPYAAFVAHRALDAGCDVFLFSDNVPVEDELALKTRARAEGRMVMGPDCGTAILAGVGYGFANRVPTGPVGIVGASGTGTQEVSCLLAAAGVGVSHAIGTGSRDLKRAVNGIMTEAGLRRLAADEGTRVVTVIAKHPDDEVSERIHRVLRDLGKPVAVRYLGTEGQGDRDGVWYASSLDECADAAVRLSRGEKPVRLDVDTARTLALCLPGTRIVGLFGGGSLAAEAAVVLGRHGIRTCTPEQPLVPGRPIAFPGHLIVDAGDDFYCVGRPHPMVDQTVRCGLIRSAGEDPSVGAILFDLVLGDGSHPDPAPELAAAVGPARRRGLPVVASVCGTNQDPQGLPRQFGVLREAGVDVFPSVAAAAKAIAISVVGS